MADDMDTLPGDFQKISAVHQYIQQSGIHIRKRDDQLPDPVLSKFLFRILQHFLDEQL